MNKHFSKIAKITLALGAAALFSFQAQAADAAAANPWPEDAPAVVYFGDTDVYGSAAHSADAPAVASVGNPAEQDAPVMLAGQREQGDAAPKPQRGTAHGMY